MVKNRKHFLQDQEQDKDVHFPTTLQYSVVSPSHSNQRIKGIQIGKEVILSLLADDMILYIENPKDATRKLLELINGCDKEISCITIH